MQKKLTITIDEDVYSGLYRVVGKRKISRFIESVVRPYVVRDDGDTSYTVKDSLSGPVFVAEGSRAAHVILTVEEYLSMAGQKQSIVDMLAKPEASDIDFDPPRLEGDLYEKSELS